MLSVTPMSPPTPEHIDGFSSWLQRRGRGSATIEAYISDVRMSFSHEGGALGRLSDRSYAPKTRRRNLAALRSWCDFTNDAKLSKSLKEVKLPSPVRRSVKQPLELAAWTELRDEIDSAPYIEEPMRAVLGMLASRGFRCGDVLRLQQDQVTSALQSGVLHFSAKGERELEYTSRPFTPYLQILATQGVWRRVEDLVSPSAQIESRRKSAAKRASRALRRCALAIGMDPSEIHTHKLRRTYAVEFLRSMAGDPESMQKLQAQMQWASAKTAFEYTDYVRREDLDAVDDAMRQRIAEAKSSNKRIKRIT